MKKLTPELREKLFPEKNILSGYRGSIAHNMYVPNTDPNSIDDIDLMSVYMAPPDHYIGINKTQEVVENFVGEWDVVSYEFMKFVRLLLKSNPNVLSLLWINDNHYIERHDYGKILIENRDLFVSKNIYYSFTKYAYSQLKKTNQMSGKFPTDLAYLAGIFDGEGHVCINKMAQRKGMVAPFFHLDVGITNTDTDLISSLQDVYGGNVGQTGVKGQHRTNCFRWRLSGPKTIEFLKLILPHLKIKRRQAEIAISFQQTIMNRRRGTPLTEYDIEIREKHRQALFKARKDKTTEVPEHKYTNSNLYKAAYMGKKRKELVKKFGYDPKAAAHCIRLLKMGTEFLMEGHLNVFRDDAPRLVEIKLGEWSLEQVQNEADRLLKLADEAYVRSTLPAEPNYGKVNEMVKAIMLNYLGRG